MTRFMIITITLLILLLRMSVVCTFNYSDLNETATSDSIDSWFQQINNQYKILNHYFAIYIWEIDVNSKKDIQDEFIEFKEILSNWKNRKCNQAKLYLNKMTSSEQRMIFLLCRGPNYSNKDERKLSKLLTKIMESYSEGKVCLPKDFDICKSSNHFWDSTFWRNPKGEINSVDFSSIYQPKCLGMNFLNGRLCKYQDSLRRWQNEKLPRNNLETSKFTCLGIEPELKDIMRGNVSSMMSNNCPLPAGFVEYWAWESWRLTVGVDIAKNYEKAIHIMNSGARNNGYRDIGECWREEFEMPNMEKMMTNLWIKIKPFYQLLHGILRNVLWKQFNNDEILTHKKSLPAHLLGSMSSSDWTVFLKKLLPLNKIDLDENIKRKNWTILDLVKRSEDFYISLGLNPMTSSFWKNSIFNKTNNNTKCHGSAVNFYSDENDDFRIIVCPEKNVNGFYEIVHELGHIEYFIHSTSQSSVIFQDSTNSAFGETIGDATFLGIMTPQHLNRLTLLPDEFLYPDVNNLLPKKYLMENQNNNLTTFDLNKFDLSLLLRMALSRIPQIPFLFVMEKLRWDLFSGKVDFFQSNEYFWKLIHSEQGIHPPNWTNRKNFYDFTVDFHLANNTPYARYFLSHFLQYQIFKGLCEFTVFGKLNSGQILPMPLHRCDIYGSKRAGNLLRKAMKLGASTHWSEVLFILTGHHEISSIALLEYYQPLILWLEKIIIEFDIPVGW